MARIHKGGLFQSRGLFKSMDLKKCEICVSCRCVWSLLDLSYGNALDHAYFMLILVDGLKINHRFQINPFVNLGSCTPQVRFSCYTDPISITFHIFKYNFVFSFQIQMKQKRMIQATPKIIRQRRRQMLEKRRKRKLTLTLWKKRSSRQPAI